MIVLVDYDYYKNIYGGSTVDGDSFPSYEREAVMIMENYCLKPKKRYEKAIQQGFEKNIKFAICKLVDNIKDKQDLLSISDNVKLAQALGIASESTKDHSISYSNKDLVLEIEKNFDARNIATMKRYLLVTGLLYRGF